MAINPFSKPAEFQIAPLPYESMIQEARQDYIRNQEANLAAEEQLGALQGQLASYDVDQADRDAYTSFMENSRKEINEFADKYKGRYMDPEARREFSALLTKKAGDPRLKAWVQTKQAKDAAMADLEKNRSEYTEFDYKNARKEINDYKTIQGDKISPFRGVGLTDKVDWSKEMIMYGDKIADDYTEYFTPLKDNPTAMMKTAVTQRLAGDIENALIDFASGDTEMREEAYRAADAQGASTPAERDKLAKEYIQGHAKRASEILASKKVQRSITASGKAKSDKDKSKMPSVSYTGSEIALGQLGQGVKNTTDLKNTVKLSKENLNNINNEIASYELRNGVYYNKKGEEATSVYNKKVSEKERLESNIQFYEEMESSLRESSKPRLAKHADYQELKEEYEDVIKDAWSRNYIEDVYRKAAKATEGREGFLATVAGGMITDNYINDYKKAHNGENPPIDPSTAAFKGMAKYNKMKEIENDVMSEDIKKYQEENSLYYGKLYRFSGKQSAENKERTSTFKASTALSGKMVNAETGEEYGAPDIKVIKDIATGNAEGDITYAGMTIDHGGMGIEVFNVTDSDGNTYKVEQENPEAIPILIANGKVGSAEYAVNRIIDMASNTKRGELPIYKGIDMKFNLNDDNTITLHVPSNEGIVKKTFSTRKEVTDFYNAYVMGVLPEIKKKVQ